MEIISYVREPRKRPKRNFFKTTKGNFSAPKKEGRLYRKNSRVEYSFSYPAERYSFKAGTVARTLSVRTVLADMGRFSSLAIDFFRGNVKRLLVLLGCLLGVTGAVILCARAASYRVSHTGPLAINFDAENELAQIDAFMSDFAMEKNTVDENGNILGESVTVSASFTQPVSFQTYKVRSGDTISGIAVKFGLKNISTLISVNDISNVRQLAAGQKLKIPSIDGIFHTVKAGESLASVTAKYNVRLESLLDVNELASDSLTVGQQLFIPGVGLDSKTLQNAMGELFILPISASFRWTSPYGWRLDPFTGQKKFHSGTDMACPTGTPVLASRSGTVSFVGNNWLYGNHIIITHSDGYQTLYAHMSKTVAKKGDWVSQGTKIGLVGSTGYSTGPHLHFTVYKNGKQVDPMTVLKK